MESFERTQMQLLAAASGLHSLVEQMEPFLQDGWRQGLREAANRLRQSCLGRKPVVALCADFQVGKSTTVNALAGGRSLSPCGRGGGLRTSTCRVELAQAAGCGEYAAVQWLTQEELSASLRRFLPPEAEEDPVSLEEDLDAAWDLLEARLAAYLTVQPDVDELERLKNAVLLLAGLENEGLRALREQRVFSLEAAGGLLQEPESALMWKRFLEGARQGRYVKTMTGLFDQYASAHLFIKAVRLYVRSPELEALDAVVADLPGLNANERDSRLAMEAYEEADVILFLLDGERQLSQQGRNSLRQLQRMGAADKVLFAVNCRKPMERLRSSALERTVLEEIRVCGFTASWQRELIYYNAFLAGRAKQGMLLLEGTLGVRTREQILWDAYLEEGKEPEDVESAWRQTVDTALRACRLACRGAVRQRGLEADVLQRMLEESGWPSLCEKLRHLLALRRLRMELDMEGLHQAADLLTEVEHQAAAGVEGLLQELGEQMETLQSRAVERRRLEAAGLQALQENPEDEDLCRRYCEEVPAACAEQVNHLVRSAADLRFILQGLGNLMRGIFGHRDAVIELFPQENRPRLCRQAVEALRNSVAAWAAARQQENSEFAEELFSEVSLWAGRENPVPIWYPEDQEESLTAGLEGILGSVSFPAFRLSEAGFQETVYEQLSHQIAKLYEPLGPLMAERFRADPVQAPDSWNRRDREECFYQALAQARRVWQEEDRILLEGKDCEGLETFINLWERQFVPLAALVRQLLSDL